MDIDKAVDLLSNLLVERTAYSDEEKEAIDMAIEALYENVSLRKLNRDLCKTLEKLEEEKPKATVNFKPICSFCGADVHDFTMERFMAQGYQPTLINPLICNKCGARFTKIVPPFPV